MTTKDLTSTVRDLEFERKSLLNRLAQIDKAMEKAQSALAPFTNGGVSASKPKAKPKAKRTRRSVKEMDAIKARIVALFGEGGDVGSIYDQLVSEGMLKPVKNDRQLVLRTVALVPQPISNDATA
jgi:transcriptional regulator